MKKTETLDEAFEVTKRPKVDFSNSPDDLRAYFEDQYNAIVLTEAINDGWKPDMMDTNQKKWFPVFRIDPSSPSGLVFGSSRYYHSNADAADASRLCFESEKASDHAGKTFTEVYKNIIL